MPTIMVQANRSEGDAGRVTLSERVSAIHLQDEHYAAQLIERLAWATIDAARLESPTDGTGGHHGSVAVSQHGLQPPGTLRESA